MSRARTLPIMVSSRVLRHISRGIYRTPAGALKELVSNAYDAAAREVTINTDWPAFREIVVTDNGTGLSLSDFKTLVQNIGLSPKIAGSRFRVPGTKGRRTTIGHYGIGWLAVGQLASRMTLRSKKAGESEGFRAELDFDQFELTTEGESTWSRVRDEQEIEQKDPQVGGRRRPVLPIGKCNVWTEQYSDSDRRSSFTKVELTNLREQTVHKLRGTLRDKQNPSATLFREYFSTYEKLLEILRRNEPMARQGAYPYEQLVWELGVYCPVAYPEVGEFGGDGELADVAAIASAAQFTLGMDGMEILKPLETEFFEDEHYKFSRVFKWIDEPYTEDETGPRVSGYLIFKPQIRPKAMQGVLVREGGVAIGTYDTTYLEYPYNEGQKFNQLTGELFASGLSGALNIDRNSFNQTDDRYLGLCGWFHDKLRTEVFPEFKKIQSQPAAKRRQENRMLVKRALQSVAESLGKRKKIEFQSLGSGRPLISVTGKDLTVNTDHPDGTLSGAKREKVLLAAALVLAGCVTPKKLDEIDRLVAGAKKKGRRT